MADLTGNGKLDVVVTDSANGTLVVLPGNGDGTLGKSVSYAAIANPLVLLAGNFGGKGQADLAVLGSRGLVVLQNDGTGRLTALAPMMLSRSPVSMTAAQFTASGHDDLAIGNQDGTISVLLGDGSGRFTALAPAAVASSPVNALSAISSGQNGKTDLALAVGNSLMVLAGNGDGTFEPGSSYTVGNGPTEVLVADVNGDSIPDLITVNRQANTFSVLVANGDGSYQSAREFVSGNGPVAAVAGNFYGNSRADLAIINGGDSSISIPESLGDGTFQAAHSYRTGLHQKAVAAGDLVGNGRVDLVVSSYCGGDAKCSSGNAYVLLADANGNYQQGSTYTLGAGPVAVALADLNGNKKLDLIALNRVDKTMMVLPGNGDGTFGEAQSYSLEANPRALFVGDLLGSGKVDVAIVSDCGTTNCTQPGLLDVWLNKGDGSLTEMATYTVGYSPLAVAGADLRGLGYMDLVVANGCGEDASCNAPGTAMVFKADGTGKFSPASEFGIGSLPSSIALGSLGKSGIDLVVAQQASDQVVVMAGDGKGGFGQAAAYAVDEGPVSLVIGDFRGSGVNDVAVANFDSSTVSVLSGTGSGTLNAAVSYAVGAGPQTLAVVSKSSGSVAGLVTGNGNGSETPLSPDVTFLPEESGTGATPTVTLSPTSPIVSTVDEPVLLSALVTGSDGTPTGNVVFNWLDSSGAKTALADCGGATGEPLVDGEAPCTTQLLPVAAVNVEADYLGETGTYTAGSSSDTPATISPAATSTTVATSGSPSSVDGSVTFTATVQVPVNAAIQPTGSVVFTDNGTAISACGGLSGVAISNWNAASGTATAACTTSALTAGSHAIIATYGNDSNYSSSNGNVTQSVQQGSTSITVNSLTNPSVVNQSVTFMATVTPSASGSIGLSGNVTFIATQGSTTTTLCSNVATSSGQATCSASFSSPGSYTITATYGNDSNFTGSTNNTLTQTVNKATTHVAVSLVGSATVNQTITLQAQVSAPGASGTPQFSGKMTFMYGTTTLCSGIAVTSGGVANCPTSALPAGSDSVTANYDGANDPDYASSSGSATITVNKVSTTVQLTSSLNPSYVNNYGGQPVLTASIPQYSTTNSYNPTGSMTFTDTTTGTTLCSSVSMTNGSAQCTIVSATAGTHAISAAYSGDANFTSSTGTLNQAVESFTLAAVNSGGSAFTAPIMVTQGYTTSSDIFTPQAINLTPAPVAGFATKSGDPLIVTCMLTPVTAGSSATAPTCTMASSTLAVAASGAQATVGVVIDATASGVTPGSYTVTLTGTDPTSGISANTTFTVFVRAVSTLTVASGQTTNNSANVTFILPANVSLTSLNCPWLYVTGTNEIEQITLADYGIACSFNPTSVASSASIQTAMVQVTVTTTGTLSASNRTGKDNMLAAGLLIPLLGIVGLVRRRRWAQSVLFRLMVLAAIGVAAMQTMGCGSSVTHTGGNSFSGTTSPGQYYLLVEGTGSDGNTYDAVLQVTVTL
jgi:hypothetical protein